MGATVNLTHHFLIAMPGMVDPNFAHTLTFVCEHNAGRCSRRRRQPADRHDARGAVRADRRAASRRRRSIDSPCMFGGPVQIDRGFVLHRPLGNWQSTLAVQRRHRPHDVEGHPRGRGARRGPAETCWSRWATRGGRPASSSTSSPHNAWLTVAADPDVVFDTAGRAAAARGDAAARHRSARGCPKTPDTPDCASDRPASRPRRPCSPSTSGRAASASRSATR